MSHRPRTSEQLPVTPALLPTAAEIQHTNYTSGWIRRLVKRLWLYWPVKCFGSIAFMALFFWCYFWILQHPRSAPVVMPDIWLDQWVGFTPSAFPIYVSLWIYVFLPPALMGNPRALVWFSAWVGGMCLFCLALFWWFPTQTPLVDIDWSRYPGLAMVKGIDAAGNACPSLHVASSVFSFFWLNRVLAQLRTPKVLQWLSAIHCLAIVWSTMATLQHVALDVLAGIIVGLVFAVASLAHIKQTA